MSKIAFIFPGQGAQYVGMGKDFYDTFATARNVFDVASKATGIDVAALCFEENEKINKTEYTQLAMLTTEVAILEVVKEKGIKADVCAGLSLGEYGALATANVMEKKDLFSLIRQRGIYMQEAYPDGGAMAAVIGMDTESIVEICDKTPGIVSIANYNCPGQIVITGEKTAVNQAIQSLEAAGAKRCIPLKVSGPFHSALLMDAGQKLGETMQQIALKKPEIPYICNVEATYITEVSQIKPLLEKQISSSVRWQQSMEKMIADGVDLWIEIGPGKTLTGFMKKINKNAKVMNIAKIEDLEKVMEEVAC